MAQTSSGTISDAPVAARTIDIYELLGILIPGVLVTCAAFGIVYSMFEDLRPLLTDKLGTIVTTMLLAGFFSLSYLVGHITVIVGHFFFRTMVTEHLLGPAIVVLVLPHRAPMYRRSPRAAIVRFFLLSSTLSILAGPARECLGKLFFTATGLQVPLWLSHIVALTFSWKLWVLASLFAAIVYALYQDYEHRVARSIGLLNRTALYSDLFKQCATERNSTLVERLAKSSTARMDFDSFSSTWFLLPGIYKTLGKKKKYSPRNGAEKKEFDRLTKRCVTAYQADEKLVERQRILTYLMVPILIASIPIRGVENIALSTLLCLRPLTFYSMIKVFENFKILRGGLHLSASLSSDGKDIASAERTSHEFEAYLAVAVEDSFRLSLFQALMNCRDAMAEKINRHDQSFRITRNASAALMSISLLFSLLGGGLSVGNELCLVAAGLGYALLLRSIYLRYQVCERELFIAFGGLSNSQLKTYFP